MVDSSIDVGEEDELTTCISGEGTEGGIDLVSWIGFEEDSLSVVDTSLEEVIVGGFSDKGEGDLMIFDSFVGIEGEILLVIWGFGR